MALKSTRLDEVLRGKGWGPGTEVSALQPAPGMSTGHWSASLTAPRSCLPKRKKPAASRSVAQGHLRPVAVLLDLLGQEIPHPPPTPEQQAPPTRGLSRNRIITATLCLPVLIGKSPK